MQTLMQILLVSIVAFFCGVYIRIYFRERKWYKFSSVIALFCLVYGWYLYTLMGS